jgi:hypothetical protein
MIDFLLCLFGFHSWNYYQEGYIRKRFCHRCQRKETLFRDVDLWREEQK